MPALALALILTVELARALPLLQSFRSMGRASARVARVARRRASEHWRERAFRLLSLHLLSRSLVAGLLLGLALIPLATAFALDSRLSLGVVAAFGDWRSRLLVAAVAIGYALVRHAARRRLLKG